ncbi:MAG: glycosyltransferase [Rubrobacteraceae bacterium]
MRSFWETIVEPVAEILQPKAIVEIGSGRGDNTRNLLEFCQENNATLHVIDPLPKYDVSEWQEHYGDHLVFHHALSLNALPKIDQVDLVLVDGDHNWYTVFNELKLIEKRCKEIPQPFPLVMLHDIGWPYGRRDLYYDPTTIPESYLKPNEKKGLRQDSPELVEGGGLNRHVHNAARENEPHSGVLTAVEDFLKRTEEQLELVKFPGFHGLGVLIPAQLKEQNPELAEFLETLDLPENVGRLTEHLEQARLEAEIRHQEHREAFTEEIREKNAEIALLRRRVSELDRRFEKASQDLETLDKWMKDLSVAIPALLSSRQWRIGRVLGELYRIARRRPRTPTVAGRLDNVVRQYWAWKSKAGDGSAPVARPQVRESRPEATARRVYNLFVTRESVGQVLRSVSGRIASASRQRIRRVRQRLKPRMPREELVREVRRRLGSAPSHAGTPLVSIIVLNRDGLHHLKKLFPGLLDHTDYPNLEFVLVDNGSTDGSIEFVRSLDAPFPVKLIENRGNVSFSEGNNQGARAAAGNLLLFMNNDIEPFEPGWLKEMVGLTESSGAGAVGARLLYPGVTEYDTPSGYAAQHRGIRFQRVSGAEHHRNMGKGEDALGEHFGQDNRCPAVTAACLLVSRSAFDAAGAFTPGYRYGSEDVDLGLKLLSFGYETVSSGRAVLFHDESSSQKVAGRGFMRENRMGNRELFFGRWGPQLRRKLELERLGPGVFWSEEKAHVVITVTSHDPDDGYGDWYTGHEIGDALEKLGWRVSYVQRKRGQWYKLPGDADYLLVLLDSYDISRVSGVTTIAWIRNWTERWISYPWFEKYDIVLVSSGISKEIIEKETNQRVASLFPIASNPARFSRTPEDPAYAADYVFTSNYWGELRGVIGSLDTAPGERLAVFGKNWENVPQVARHSRGPVPYKELPRVYSSTKLLIDDAASSTLPYGSVNSRIFDALATGTPVVTNCEAGVRELFDEDFPTYSSPQELRSQLDRLLGDEELRAGLANRYREVVLREHTYGRRAEQLRDLLRRRAGSLSFCIKIGAPGWKVAEAWGDLHYARAMRRQLERRGHPCRIQTLDEWDSLEGLRYDVVVHLKGLSLYTPKPGQLNVLWNISHPAKLTAAECDRYDLVFVASKRWAEDLKSRTATPILVLEQATDPEVFFPDYDPAHDRELVFVGNSRRVERRILRDLLPTSRDLAVWGADWKGLISTNYIAGEHLPNRQVRRAYSSASIVLNDHWDDMREHGFVSNRVYDALACGALVVSDDLPELRENFGDAIVTYGSPKELRELVEYYLASPEEREEKGRQGRELVLSRHTFEHRLEELLRHVEQRRAGPELRGRLSGLDRANQPARSSFG